jgi:hypothetical protein
VPKHEPTWTDVGAIAEAVFVLTRSADLPHDLLVELALPSIRRLALMGEQLLADPHGDGEAAVGRWTAPPGEVEAEPGAETDARDASRMREALRRIVETGTGANEYPWIFIERVFAGDTIEEADAKAAKGWP